jgi:exonuclease VII large subunit
MRYVLYIEINSSHRLLPQIAFKKERNSNVIKKSDLLIYSEAKALLSALEERVEQYQQMLEEQVVQLIEDKEQTLNLHVTTLYNEIEAELQADQAHWFDEANQRLVDLVEEQYQGLSQLKEELKHRIAQTVTLRLTDLSMNETLIEHLVALLHAEIDDEAKSLAVERTYVDGFAVLTIENDDQVISIETQSIIEALRASLETT